MNKASIVSVLTGLSLAACADQAPGPKPDSLVTAEQAVITQCPFLDPADPSFYGGPPVDYARELMITDVGVVDEPCRTTWSGSCAGGGTQGVWTFGELMRRMAGTGSAQAFAAEFVHQWEVPQVVNGFAIPPRPNIRPLIIDPWLVASGCPAGAPIVGPGACPLDLKRAPLRLLAIVNRTDLECTNYPNAGDGEMRMVFGFINSAGAPTRATVILEYKLPPQRNGNPYTATDWQNDWHVLSTLPMASPTYLKVLEMLTNDITTQGAIPGGPNLGTAINQVRTNEIDFAGPPWKMREARLANTGGGPSAMILVPTTTGETPHDSFNQTGPLDTHLALNIGALAAFTQSPVPAALLGGETSAPLPGPTPYWEHSPSSPLAPDDRHHFGFASCNGCHLMETNTPFLHIGVRPFGAPSPLSPFLSTSLASGGGGLPASGLVVNDPAGTGATFKYNEPWRRVCEASRMLQGFPRCWSRGNGSAH